MSLIYCYSTKSRYGVFYGIADKLRGNIKIVDSYLNNPEIRSPFLQIDTLGPGIDFVITTLSQDLDKKRLVQTFITIHEELVRINETMVDLSYIKGEEFHDNMKRLIEYSIRTRDKEKIRLFCRNFYRFCSRREC